MQRHATRMTVDGGMNAAQDCSETFRALYTGSVMSLSLSACSRLGRVGSGVAVIQAGSMIEHKARGLCPLRAKLQLRERSGKLIRFVHERRHNDGGRESRINKGQVATECYVCRHVTLSVCFVINSKRWFALFFIPQGGASTWDKGTDPAASLRVCFCRRTAFICPFELAPARQFKPSVFSV